MTFERGSLSPPVQLAGFPAVAALEGGPNNKVSNWLELQLYWPHRRAATHFPNDTKFMIFESAFVNRCQVAAQFCVATAMPTRQSTVGWFRLFPLPKVAA